VAERKCGTVIRLKPALFGVYWLAVLLMTLWVMLLGVGDYFATRTHGHVALARLRIKQKELEREIAEIKHRGSNGRDTRGGCRLTRRYPAAFSTYFRLAVLGTR
jgi:hypothetical protein